MNKTLLIGITVLFLLALAAPFTTASINQSEATCSDIRMVFPEVRLLEDSHETFDFDILNYGESAFRLTNITFDNKNSGDFDISADDHDGTINEADSEQFSFTVETDSVSRLTSGTAEVIIKGTFDQGVSCTNIRASFSVFVEDEEGAGNGGYGYGGDYYADPYHDQPRRCPDMATFRNNRGLINNRDTYGGLTDWCLPENRANYGYAPAQADYGQYYQQRGQRPTNCIITGRASGYPNYGYSNWVYEDRYYRTGQDRADWLEDMRWRGLR